MASPPPEPFRPLDHATFSAERMGKATLYQSERVLVGLNTFLPGQEHRLHAHAAMDKVYHVLSGTGLFLLEDGDRKMAAGDMLIAPADSAHGIRNDSHENLVVLAILAPAP